MHEVSNVDALRALPVLIEVSHTREGSLRRYVDGVLGWQPVDADTYGPFRARVRLTDDPATLDEIVPTVLLVDDQGISAAQAKRLAQHPRVAVCIWPSERDQLPQVVAQVLQAQGGESGVRTLTVGGAAGGVGTTTLALSLGGVSAWHGHATLVVVNDVSSKVRLVPSAALTDSALWEQATPTAGIDGCRVIRVNDGPPLMRVRDPRISQSVYDMGVSHDVDVLVVRPDRQGLFALGHTTASVVIVVGSGVVQLTQLTKAAGSRRVMVVSHSVRVARAIAQERVPAGMPGTWLEPLISLVRTKELFPTG